MELLIDSQAEQIRAACSDQQSGSLIVSVGRHLANLSISQGAICYAFYRAQTGMQALTQLRDDLHTLNEPLRLKFAPGTITRRDDSLLESEALFEFLGAEKAPQPAQPIPPTQPEQPAVTATAPEPEWPEEPAEIIAGVPFNDLTRTVLQRALLPHTGKHTMTICQSLAAETDSLRVAIDLLEEQLNDPRAAEQIKNDIRRDLEPMIASGRLSVDAVSSVPTKTLRKTSSKLLETDQERQCVIEVFSKIAGILAPFVLASEEVRNATGLRNLIDFLYLQIPDQEIASRFRDEARAELAKLRA